MSDKNSHVIGRLACARKEIKLPSVDWTHSP